METPHQCFAPPRPCTNNAPPRQARCRERPTDRLAAIGPPLLLVTAVPGQLKLTRARAAGIDKSLLCLESLNRRRIRQTPDEPCDHVLRGLRMVDMR